MKNRVRKGIAAALVLSLAVLTIGCGSQNSINWVQQEQDTDYRPVAALENVNDNARLFAVYEYIVPSDTPREQIKWVSVEAKKPQERPLKVGFSQMEVNNDWRIYENASIFQEAEDRGVELLYRDAESSIEKQAQDVAELVDAGVDYLILAPRQYFGLEEALAYAKEKEVPVILVDRIAAGEPGEDYVTCIMGDFIDVGKRAAEILAQKFEGERICVFEVTGTVGSSVASYLSQGFRSVADKLGWEIITVDGDFDQAGSLKPVEEVLINDRDRIDAVFTHIDDSALTTINAMREAGLEPGGDIEAGEIPIVSMGGYKDAMKAIVTGDLLATIECSPRFGPVVFHYIERLEESERIRSRIVVPGKTYDLSNALYYMDSEGY